VKGMKIQGWRHSFIFYLFYFLGSSHTKNIFQNMKKKIFMVAAVIFSSRLQAQTLVPVNSGDSSKTLDEVIFTANKYPQKQSSTGKVLTVINRQTLEKNSGRTLAQILNEQAGVVINGSQSPLGATQYVYVRGASAANTLILVDGVPANDASGISVEFDINHFSIDQIERVEILKGAQSVLYGSDAVAGVINIITNKQGNSKPVGFNANLSAGSYGTIKGTAAVTGKINIITYNVQYSKLKSDGFSAAQDTAGNNNFDRDGFNKDLFSVNLSAKATKNWQLRLFGQYDKYNADIDEASFTDDKNYTINNKNLQAGISSVSKFDKGSVTLNLNLNNTERKLNDLVDNPNDYAYNGLYKGKAVFAEAYTNLNLQQHIGLLFGTDIRKQKADIKTTYGDLGSDSLKATQFSGYASLLLKSLGGFNAEIGGRFTNHSVFGSAFTYSINPSYIISKQLKLFANIATGFRAPTIYNLASEYGNKDLEPEKSNSYEGGFQYLNEKNTINLRVTYFNRIIKNVIIFKSLSLPPYAQYDNADKQKDHGFELEAVLHPSQQWSITANYAFVNGHIETVSKSTRKDTSISNLYRRPKNIINTIFSYQATKKLFAGVSFRWVDKAMDQFYNSSTFETELKELKSYHNLDVYAAYQAHSSVKIFVDLRNITNQQYFEVYGYSSRKFNFMTGAIVNF
jgi:vitamin B12 transporter